MSCFSLLQLFEKPNVVTGLEEVYVYLLLCQVLLYLRDYHIPPRFTDARINTASYSNSRSSALIPIFCQYFQGRLLLAPSVFSCRGSCPTGIKLADPSCTTPAFN